MLFRVVKDCWLLGILRKQKMRCGPSLADMKNIAWQRGGWPVNILIRGRYSLVCWREASEKAGRGIRMEAYTADFFRKEHDIVLQSARQVVPIVMSLVKPRRVIDVGCGTGVWLSVFREHGVEDVLGIDGAYVDLATLKIPRERFLSFDLSKPIDLDGKFDLAVSLEVAEHLPASSAAAFVESLTKLSPLV